MKLYKVEAIVLRSRIMREADKIITVFSRERGKQQLAAHGAAKAKSRKRGAVQPLCHSQLLVHQGKDLDTVSQAESITYFENLRTDLEKLTLAGYLCELVDGLNEDEQPNEPLFILLLTTLKWLNQPKINFAAAEKLISGFEIKLLGLLGYLPQLNCCANCGSEISGRINFSIEQGGLLCRQCAADERRLFSLTPLSLAFLKQLIVTKPGELAQLNPSAASANEVKRLLHRLVRHYLERRAKTLDFLETLHKNIRFGSN